MKTAEVEGKALEQRFHPSGVPSDYLGRRLWVSDTRTGETRAVCGEAVTCWRGSWSPSSAAAGVLLGRRWRGRTVDLRRELVLEVEARGKPAHAQGQALARRRGGVESRRQDCIRTRSPRLTQAAPGMQPKNAAASVTTGAAEGVGHGLSHGCIGQRGRRGQHRSPWQLAQRVLPPREQRHACRCRRGYGRGARGRALRREPRPSNLRLSPDGKWLSYLSVYSPDAIPRRPTRSWIWWSCRPLGESRSPGRPRAEDE